MKEVELELTAETIERLVRDGRARCFEIGRRACMDAEQLDTLSVMGAIILARAERDSNPEEHIRRDAEEHKAILERQLAAAGMARYGVVEFGLFKTGQPRDRYLYIIRITHRVPEQSVLVELEIDKPLAVEQLLDVRNGTTVKVWVVDELVETRDACRANAGVHAKIIEMQIDAWGELGILAFRVSYKITGGEAPTGYFITINPQFEQPESE